MALLYALFSGAPWLGLLPALVLAALYARTRDPVVRVASGAWGVYAAYEYLMQWGVLCSGECNIRIDLLVLYPVLLFLTVFAFGRGAWRALRPS